MEWSASIDTVHRKGQSRLFFLRWLRSFIVCSDMMCIFYQTVIESALFYVVVCWGSGFTVKNCRRLDKLVKMASSVIDRELVPVRTLVQERMRRKFYSLMVNSISTTSWQDRGAAAVRGSSHCAAGLRGSGGPLFPQPRGFF